MDYVAAFTSEQAFCVAVEKRRGLTSPERARYVRVVAVGLRRVASHLPLAQH